MLAASYLQGKHYKIIAMNYRSRFGEIDLIVSNQSFLVFVEVKLRKTDKFASAFEHVDIHKQQKIRTTAEVFLSEYCTDLQPRFDVIEIYALNGVNTKHPKINHMEDAF